MSPALFAVRSVAVDFGQYAAQVSAYLKAFSPLNGIELLAQNRSKTGNRVYRYRLKYKDGNLIFVMGLNKEGKIARLNLQAE